MGVALPVKPPLFLWFWKPKVYQPSLGNKVRMSKIYLDTGIKDEELDSSTILESSDLLVRHSFAMCRIIAICMCKGYLMPLIFNRILARWLMWKMKPAEIVSVCELLILFTGTADFMSFTRFLKSLKVTGLGQQANRSQ